MKLFCKNTFRIGENIIGNPGDILEVNDAIPKEGETLEDVAGYCDIINHSTGHRWNAIWSEVEGNPSLASVVTTDKEHPDTMLRKE